MVDSDNSSSFELPICDVSPEMKMPNTKAIEMMPRANPLNRVIKYLRNFFIVRVSNLRYGSQFIYIIRQIESLGG
jgi:hypothetical protein